MTLTVLLPHYRTGKMTAYAIAQLIKYRGDHDLKIIVIDNNAGDGSIAYLAPFRNAIEVVSYPKNKLQSHGIAFDYVLPKVETEWFFTMESDGYPTVPYWLDYYAAIIDTGYDAAGSVLKLSGGTYLHPCGAIYRKRIWEEANLFIEQTPYWYFPNMAMKEKFPCHLMVHEEILHSFNQNPEDYIELADGYRPYSTLAAGIKCGEYSPTRGPFHNGMGGNQEVLSTYGQRNFESEVPTILLKDAKKLVYRIGYEPGQFLSYFMKAKGYKIMSIPTETKWLPGKENQQQEYTINNAGFKHLWGISAYHGFEGGDPEIARVKQVLPDELYDELPLHLQININGH